MDELPKYSADLIEQLDKMISRMHMDGLTAAGWGRIDEGRVRQLAFLAGQRALVDLLLGMQREMEEARGDSSETQDIDTGGPELYERVFDPSGAEHKNVASVHMAGSFTNVLGSDDGGEG